MLENKFKAGRGRMKPVTKICILTLIVLAISSFVFEAAMRLHYGFLPEPPEDIAIREGYIDIYKNHFSQIQEGGRTYIYNKLIGPMVKIPLLRGKNSLRIFILGGSVAVGFDNIYFQQILDNLCPEIKFEVANAGIIGYDAYRVSLVAKEILTYDPDLLIVLSGNNEFYEKVRINIWAYRINNVLRQLWSCRKLQDFITAELKARGLLDRRRSAEERFDNYERTLRHIVRMAKRKNVPVFMCTLPFNFKDMPPQYVGQEFINKSYLSACYRLHEGHYAKAIREFKKFLEANPESALGHYFLGRAFQGIRDYAQAKKHYLIAAEANAVCWPNSNPRSNRIVRKICAEEGEVLVDLEQAFMDVEKNGFIGIEQLPDNCHWWHEGNFITTEALINSFCQNKDRFPADFRPGIDKLKSFRCFDKLPSLRERATCEEDIRRITCQIVWESIVWPDGFSEIAICRCHTLYLMNPDFLWGLQFQANLIEVTLDILNRKDIYQIAPRQDVNAYWPQILNNIGETYRRLQLYEQALSCFDKSIALNAENYLPYLGKALVYNALQDKRKSSEYLTIAEMLSDNLGIKYYRELMNI
ncbi:MAG: hypothetical protein KKB82_00995 [Candidatus Omnitrophica bacterium]|nr:hypothetical protein [Candidatus Omnitrophota bacterium]MBU1924478.1 hypothetical protein [Candidatus Omnitrophota bacterium]